MQSAPSLRMEPWRDTVHSKTSTSTQMAQNHSIPLPRSTIQYAKCLSASCSLAVFCDTLLLVRSCLSNWVRTPCGRGNSQEHTGTYRTPSKTHHHTYNTFGMASKLCCTAEQEGHPDSPQLPNARLAEPPAVTQLPLLPKLDQSAISLFTSDQTGDLHELRNIFDHVKDNDSAHASPTKAPSRARFKKSSIYSLHSIHKMKSMRSLIRRRFSRDLVKKSSEYQLSDAGSGVSLATDTVVRQKPEGPAVQLKLTKDDLRKDLLSDKRPEDGGYDSDAQVLHDIAKNLEKRTPSKRPSIHSIEWATSTGR